MPRLPCGSDVFDVIELHSAPPNERGCRLWTGAKSRGYAKLCRAGKTVTVTRLLLAKRLGRPLRPGMHALHECDTPACVTDAHLFEGTHKQNQEDKVSKGRHVRGAEHVLSKFTDADVLIIQAAHAAGFSSYRLAEQYGVSHTAVLKAVNGKTWSHLQQET